jgi:MYXO-CTERM domain-containing protein
MNAMLRNAYPALLLAAGLSLATPHVSALTVYSGSATIPGTWLIDFETGAIVAVDPAADVWWSQISMVTRALTPASAVVTGSTSRLTGLGMVDYSALGVSHLQALTYDNAPIDGSDDSNLLVPGYVFAVHTTAGNYVKAVVTGPFDPMQNNGLPIRWETLSPVPEPGTWALGLAGLLAVAGRVRRVRHVRHAA